MTAPVLFSVRVTRKGSLERVIPPLALVMPVPLIDPPAQARAPEIVSVSLPASVPLDCVIVPPTLLPLVPLRVSVPPVIDRAFTNAAPLVTVRGPVVKVIFALLTRFVMVWFVLDEMVPTVIVADANVVSIQTLSVETGSTPVLQFVTVVH